MTSSFRSEELKQLLAKIYQKGATGFVSITVQDGTRPVYGTLQVSEGQLLSAQFRNLTGRNALEQISNLELSNISFARSSVTSPRDADIPEITDVIDLSQVPAARVKTKAKTRNKTKAKSGKAEANTNGFGIFPRVLGTVLIAALLPLIGLWAFNYLTIQQEVSSGIEETLGQTSELVTSEVNNWLGNSVLSLTQISNLFDINSAALNYDSRHPILTAATDAVGLRASATDANGQVVARSDGVESLNLFDREYIQQALSGLDVGHQVIMSRTSGKPALCISIPHVKAGATTGVIFQCGDLGAIAEFLGRPQIGESSTLFITDAKDRLIAHSSLELPSDDFLDFSAHPALASNTREVVNYTTDDSDKVAFIQETDLGWNVVVEKTRSEAFSELRQVERQTIALFVVALMLVLAASYLLSRRFVKPIQNLTEVAEAISLGNLGINVEGMNRGDELGSLARAIERLRVSVKVMFTELRSQQGS